jgi:hypothetical protein
VQSQPLSLQHRAPALPHSLTAPPPAGAPPSALDNCPSAKSVTRKPKRYAVEHEPDRSVRGPATGTPGVAYDDAAAEPAAQLKHRTSRSRRRSYLAPEHREEHLASVEDLIRRARAQRGCLDFVIAGDLVESDRVNLIGARGGRW